MCCSLFACMYLQYLIFAFATVLGSMNIYTQKSHQNRRRKGVLKNLLHGTLLLGFSCRKNDPDRTSFSDSLRNARSNNQNVEFIVKKTVLQTRFCPRQGTLLCPLSPCRYSSRRQRTVPCLLADIARQSGSFPLTLGVD